MKILYLLDTFPSPTETFIAREIEALRKRGFEIEIWALNAGQGARKIPQPILGRFSSNRWKTVGEHFWKTQRREIESAAHIHAAWASIPAEIAPVVGQKSGKSWSFFAHARDLWVEGGDLKSKLQSAKWATSCTRAGVEELRKHDSGARIIYAPHGIELAKYPWKKWNPSGEHRLLGVGRLVAKKGWEDALEAATLLNWPLTLIGDGPLLPRFDVCNAVSVLGALSHERVIQEMQRADCLLLPSRKTQDGDRDGLANVLIEAAALGLPIVTTDAGSACDLINESSGILFESGSVLALCDSIRAVFADVEATRVRCLAARKRLEEQFDIDKNVGVLAELFGESEE